MEKEHKRIDDETAKEKQNQKKDAKAEEKHKQDIKGKKVDDKSSL